MERGNGRVYLRGTTYWVRYFLRGNEFRESAKTGDEKEAAKFLRQRTRETGADLLGARKFVTPANLRLTVADLVAALRAHFELAGKLSPQNKSELSRVEADFGNVRASALTGEAVDKYIQVRIGDGDAPATINRRMSFLKRAFRLAIRRGTLNTVPAFTHLMENNARKGFFSDPDFRKVHATLPANLQDYCLFAFLTAWRKGEVSSLTWADVHDGVIRLSAENSKNGEGRSIAVAGELVAILERRKAARLVGGDTLTNLVFHRDGQPIVEFRKAWRSACKRAGFPNAIFHDLRRSGVRQLIRSGCSQTVAMRISGHKTDAMFRRYNITDETDLRDAMLAVEKYNAAQSAQASNVVAMQK
jgi:integrase